MPRSTLKNHHGLSARFWLTIQAIACRLNRAALLLGVLLLQAVSGSVVHAQLRIVDYNSSGVHDLNSNSSPTASLGPLQTIFQAIAAESTNGVSRPVDVFALQEQNEFNADDISTITNMLNSVFKDANGVGIYAHSVLTGDNSSGGNDTTQMIIYNTKTVQLVAEKEIGASSLGGGNNQIPRTPIRYELRPVGYATDGSNDFYLYNSHYKASMDSPNTLRRQAEAKLIRMDADTLGAGARIIYAGDYNVYGSTEPMWTELTTSTVANGHAASSQAYDPLNQVDHLSSIGAWNNNSSFKAFDTQSPSTTAQYDMQVTGGMDDRFDYQLLTSALTGTTGMAYIPGSYHAFANNNTHTFNGAITTGTGASAAVLTALTQASDHLPVVSQYQLPAKMGTALAALPPQVIVNTPLAAQLTVTNTAGDGVVVTNTIGADKLNYIVATSGAASGSTGGNGLAAFATGNMHNLSLSTAAAGAKTGAITISATSPQVPNAIQTQNVSYSVLDHANASFTSVADTNSETIDLGSFFLKSGTHQTAFSINNLISTMNFTAGLDYIGTSGTGDTSALSTNFATFPTLAAGGNQGFQAQLNTANAGSFSASYTLKLSDQTSLPGATAQQLTLNLTGTVGYRPGDLNLDGQITNADLDLLLVALTNLPQYQSQVNLSNTDLQTVLDVNGDHSFNNADIQPLLVMMNSPSQGNPLSVPEPATWLLAAIGGMLLLRRGYGARGHQN